jgi:glycosyltransferase involved in cell wall biosynthesis
MRAPVGGLFRHVLDLASEQAARGHKVGIVADSNASDSLTARRLKAIEPKLALGLALLPMGRRPGLSDLSAVVRVTAHARPLGLDILHGHGAKGGAYARLSAQVLKACGQRVAAIYTPHGGSLNFRPDTPAGAAVVALERILRRMTDGLIFESAYARATYAERVGVDEVPVRVIPNGLQPQDFSPHEPEPGAADFLFLGELRLLKGVDVLIRAIAELSRTRDVRALIVGTGPDEGAFRALVHALGLEGRISFRGPMPARDAFRLARVLVVPSRAESFPYIVLEAAAAGMPLIASRVGGIPEIVAGTGMTLLEPADASALAGAMEVALSAPHVAAAQARRLCAAVGGKFTVAAMASAVLEFYATALDVNPPLSMVRNQPA